MNTSSGFHAAVGGKVKLKKHKGGKSGAQKLPSGLASAMKRPKPEQQPLPVVGLSSYGRRRKSKMRGI